VIDDQASPQAAAAAANQPAAAPPGTAAAMDSFLRERDAKAAAKADAKAASLRQLSRSSAAGARLLTRTRSGCRCTDRQTDRVD
jgi:hypothetical protein